MTDYMLTTTGASGPRDVQVNNADGIREAIRVCEKLTGCRVDHGRGGIGSKFDPAVIIDAATGDVAHLHDRNAVASMQPVKPPRAVVTPR